jgi:hypothetical protein
MTKAAYEWGFDEPSEAVDLERIYRELSGCTGIEAYAYLEQLRAKAPIVWGRLKAWAKQRSLMTWVRWD